MDTNIITLKAKTNQEAFDMVARHLHGMVARAYDHKDLACVYETEDDKSRCAVGALLVLDTPAKHRWAKKVRAAIKDLVYGQREKATAHAECSGLAPLCVFPGDVDVSLLQEMQQAHDSQYDWRGAFTGWDRMRDIAGEYDLNTKALDALGV